MKLHVPTGADALVFRFASWMFSITSSGSGLADVLTTRARSSSVSPSNFDRDPSQSSSWLPDDPRARGSSSRAPVLVRLRKAHATERGSAQSGCSGQSLRDPVSIPHDFENGRVATGLDRGLSPQVSGLFPPSLGAGAGNATLRLGDIQRAVTGQGLTPLHGGYVELLTFPRFNSGDGGARLELKDWQIILPSLSVPIPC
jgi:hypothetical protein